MTRESCDGGEVICPSMVCYRPCPSSCTGSTGPKECAIPYGQERAMLHKNNSLSAEKSDRDARVNRKIPKGSDT